MMLKFDRMSNCLESGIIVSLLGSLVSLLGNLVSLFGVIEPIVRNRKFLYHIIFENESNTQQTPQ